MPAFFEDFGVTDDVEGRFEVLTLHMYLVLQRLKSGGEAADAFSQELFDTFFTNMDDSLRELGVGDMAIGKKIRNMAEAFYGRVGAYEASIGDKDALSAAISRNVFLSEDASKGDALAGYLQHAKAHIDEISISEIINGAVHFPAIKDSEAVR